MKIRTDFVTNSSSSSFIAIKVESKELGRLIPNLYLRRGHFDKNGLVLKAHEGEVYKVPSHSDDKSDFSAWLVDVLRELLVFNLHNLPPEEKIEEIIEIIRDNSASINHSIEKYKVEVWTLSTDGPGSNKTQEIYENGKMNVTTTYIDNPEKEMRKLGY